MQSWLRERMSRITPLRRHRSDLRAAYLPENDSRTQFEQRLAYELGATGASESSCALHAATMAWSAFMRRLWDDRTVR